MSLRIALLALALSACSGSEPAVVVPAEVDDPPGWQAEPTLVVDEISVWADLTADDVRALVAAIEPHRQLEEFPDVLRIHDDRWGDGDLRVTTGVRECDDLGQTFVVDRAEGGAFVVRNTLRWLQ